MSYRAGRSLLKDTTVPGEVMPSTVPGEFMPSACYFKRSPPQKKDINQNMQFLNNVDSRKEIISATEGR